MTGNQVKRIIEGMGISSTENVQLPKLTTIIMSQNFYVVPERDFFTFDYTNELIKIKQREPKKNKDGSIEYKDWSDHKYDIYFDMKNIVGLEMLSAKSRF